MEPQLQKPLRRPPVFLLSSTGTVQGSSRSFAVLFLTEITHSGRVPGLLYLILSHWCSLALCRLHTLVGCIWSVLVVRYS
jgi:hypothetical protein